MPIFSYLATPATGAMDELVSELKALSNCTVVPADNLEVLLLVTETPDEESEKKLQKQLKNIPSLQSLSLTYGHTD